MSPSPSPHDLLSGEQGEDAQEAALRHLIEVMVVFAFSQIRLVSDGTLLAHRNSLSTIR
jgi:hypothetical protein